MSKSRKISKENAIRYIQLGLNISYYRKLAGYTQEDLAEETKLSRSYISAIEAPNQITSMSLEVLFDIAKALRIEPSQLLELR